jgi:hypothetical protein
VAVQQKCWQLGDLRRDIQVKLRLDADIHAQRVVHQLAQLQGFDGARRAGV